MKSQFFLFWVEMKSQLESLQWCKGGKQGTCVAECRVFRLQTSLCVFFGRRPQSLSSFVFILGLTLNLGFGFYLCFLFWTEFGDTIDPSMFLGPAMRLFDFRALEIKYPKKKALNIKYPKKTKKNNLLIN